MPYRSAQPELPRTLTVPNHSHNGVLLTGVTGVFFAVAGVVCSPMTGIVALPAGTEVVTSAMGTVFVLLGVIIAGLALRMRGSRTIFSLDRSELVITVHTGGGPSEQHQIDTRDIEHVEIEGTQHDGTFRARIVLRSRASIGLGEGHTLWRGHTERMALAVRSFLSGSSDGLSAP